MSSPETEPTESVDDLVEPSDDLGEGADAPAADPTEADLGDGDPSDGDRSGVDAAAAEEPDGGTSDGDTSDGDTSDDDDADGRSLLSDLPPLSVPDQVEPVRRRRRRDKRGADDAPSADQPPMPSLTSPLLSGRSLEPTRPKRRFELLRDHPRWLIAAVVLVLVVAGLVAGKLFAERAADSAMETRSAELEELLADATPEEFLAFSSGVEQPGSIAERTRNLDGFVNVKATASQSFIRFQPSGWWAGFTERCLVAVVQADGVTITVPKKACIRVEAPPS